MSRKFVNDLGGKFKTPLKDDGGKTVATLLWGDSVKVHATNGADVDVSVRGRRGWIPKSALTDEGLLEIYVIDVGQGDGVLMRTTDDKWHLIDAGVSNSRQMTGKGTANFLRWKFIEDLKRDAVELESIIVTHPDFDHYGGLIDLFAGKVHRPEREFELTVERFFHSGMARFKDGALLGAVVKGTAQDAPIDAFGVRSDGRFITELLDGKASFKSPPRAFERTFADYAKGVGSVPKKVARISHQTQYLPGYNSGGSLPAIRVLGPILEDVHGRGPGLRVLGSDSVTRNGHSVVLRVDYGKARMLLTGDLNTKSQQLLLSHHPAAEFASDVAKGCHHGSDDIDLRFVKAMGARATVISSGDNESYAHPRPRVLGASARYGRESRTEKGTILPPLLYSTELARSVALAYAAKVRKEGGSSNVIDAAEAEVLAAAKGAMYRPLDHVPLATDLIYGLVNVRTDGERIMCAYMKEAGTDFDIQVFRAGIDP